jgi:hypothetical protein
LEKLQLEELGTIACRPILLRHYRVFPDGLFASAPIEIYNIARAMIHDWKCISITPARGGAELRSCSQRWWMLDGELIARRGEKAVRIFLTQAERFLEIMNSKDV